VLHVIPAVAPRYGGPSRAVFGMCRALSERGIDPVIATTDADGEGCLPVQLGTPVSFNGTSTVFFRRQSSERFKYSRPMAIWLDQHVHEFDAVHIHAVFSHVCLAAARACRRHGVPYIVRPLGSLDPWSLRQRRLGKWLLLRVAAARMLRGAAFVHYTTNEERRLAEAGLRLGRGAVIPLGVDPELLDESRPATRMGDDMGIGQAPYVLALGRIHEKKGLELLIDAFLEAVHPQELQTWRLVLAGDGEPRYVAALRALASRNGGQERVIFSGWLEGQARVAALRRAALLASPSHQENFGLSVVEALACGVPVLVSPQVNLAAEIEGAGAGWVVPLDRAALVTSLRDAMRHGDERTRRGRAGRELVCRRFTWSAVGEQLLAVYRTATDHTMMAV
jgi:glycosyltransferase involved in cell wall biosynthesis